MKRLIVLLAACLMLSQAALAQTPKVALPGALTGPEATYGENVKAGAQLKMEELAAAGQRPFELAFFDDQCQAKEAAVVGSRIAGDKSVVAVLGHVCSGPHLAAMPMYLKAGIPMITATATSPAISKANKNAKGEVMAFRTVYLDDYQGRFLAQYAAKALGLKKVAVFYEQNDYGLGLKQAFVEESGKLGLNVVGTEAYAKNVTDFTPQLTKLKAQEPDGIFLAGYYQEASLITGQARKLGITATLFGGEGIDNTDLSRLAGAAADGVLVATPFFPEAGTQAAKDFAAKFKAKYGREAESMSAQAYDAAGILAAAVAAAGPDRAKIRDYLAAMNSPEKAYKGVSGNIYFNQNGEPTKTAFVKMVQGQGFVPAPKQLP